MGAYKDDDRRELFNGGANLRGCKLKLNINCDLLTTTELYRLVFPKGNQRSQINRSLHTGEKIYIIRVHFSLIDRM